MSEWLKEHAWKVCILQKGIQGSNPCLSAFQKKTAYGGFFLKLVSRRVRRGAEFAEIYKIGNRIKSAKSVISLKSVIQMLFSRRVHNNKIREICDILKIRDSNVVFPQDSQRFEL